MRAREALIVAALGLGLTLGAAACTSNSDDSPKSDAPSGSAPASSGSGGLSASPTPSGSPLSGDCGSIMPVSAVNQVMGGQVTGDTSFIIGEPDTSIDRISYLNCRYGLPATPAPAGSGPAASASGPAPTPQVEIGISAYGSAASAQSRVQGTIEAYLQTGATQKNVPVGALTGVELVGSGDPTIVVASGNKTVAVTVVAALVPDATRDAILSGLAQRALTGAGG
jgi:hypothetical protein